MPVYDQLETVWGLGTAENRVAEVRVTAEEGLLLSWARERGHAWAKPLAYPLPAALAEALGAIARAALDQGERRTERLGAALRRELKRRGLPGRFAAAARDLRRERGEGFPPAQEVSAVRAALDGRRLLAAEVARFLPAGVQLFPEQILRSLEYLRLTGEVTAQPAVVWDGAGWRCGRCGSQRIQPAPCATCGDPACPLCCDCSVLGEARGCRRLYARPGSPAGHRLPSVVDRDPPLPAALTAAQRRAAAALTSWFRAAESPPELLLWAVCGAGKTLAVRPLVELAIASGWRVLYISPRREVIQQVAPDLPAGALTLLTTHQALRWEAAFDLIILDEPDAFPYRGNLLLEQAVRRAGRPGCRRVYLTATPDCQMLSAVERGEMAQVLLPVRHHGQPVPVPEMLTMEGRSEGRLGRQGETRLAAEIMTNQDDERRSVLLFAPTVELCAAARRELEASLAALGRPQPVWWVHSGHPDRKELIGGFRRGECRALVSTSVLERGVTFPGVDVIVLHADHPLFDRVGLVQMAGRAGRTAGDPFGRVWFIGARVSGEMLAARHWITAMNEAARR
ncbi:MAG: helicase-related protein [Chitinophagales bacterium]